MVRSMRATRLYVGGTLVMAILAVAAMALPASAGGSSGTTADPIGDTAQISGPGSTPAYLDIVAGAVTKQGKSFEFSMDLAALVPSEPLLVTGVRQYSWFWFLDTDPTTFPTGFPRAPGLSVPPEFALWVAWDGVQFTAYIVDRRPTLTGGKPRFTPVGFSVNDAHVSAFVDAGIIDDPASFRFRVYTRAWWGPPGTEGFLFTDGAPNAAPGTAGYFVAWPS